jgi:signal transduction histidine kinase
MNKALILVVEDDRNLMESIRDILEIQDYRVLTATNGQDALEVLHSLPTPPDLIVSDIMMPSMNGYEFFEAVRNESRWLAIPFIFLTAKADTSDVRAGKSMGADEYVTKPFDTEDLLIAVDAKLRRHKELQQIQQSHIADIKRSILTILNHEFRTPLTYVVAYADMLNRDASQLSYEEIMNFLRGVNAGADRLRRLVESFILLVELETGEAEKTFQWRRRKTTDLTAILNAAVALEQNPAAEKGVELRVDHPSSPLPAIVVDNDYLRDAVARLVDNGIKFSDKDGCVVTVSAYSDGDSVCILVSDQGRGIPEHELESIWEVFYQIDREKYEDQGPGAGLPIVKRIVDLHHGTVEVYSQFGEGSQFVIRLPTVNN